MSDLLLTPAQQHALERQLRDTSDASLFRRTLAVLEVGRGRPVAEIARLLRTSRPSVYYWLARYRSDPEPAGLADQRGGNHPTLWTEELCGILVASLAQPPDRFGYRAVEWTVPLLREQLAHWGGRRPSATSVRRQLHQQGYVWKRPRYVLERDPEAEKKTPDPSPTPAPGANVGETVRG